MQGNVRPWTTREARHVMGHPEMAASSLARELGRTTKAVERFRERYGRCAPGQAPTCAKCGERPVDMRDRRARAWGLCAECMAEESALTERTLAEHRILVEKRRIRPGR